MTKIILVGMFDSVHFAKWVQMIHSRDSQILLFPSSPHRRTHPILERLIRDPDVSIRPAPFLRYVSIPLWLADQILEHRIRGFILRIITLRFRPDVVHALELQQAGYLADLALRGISKRKPLFIVTNYGSDIFWFARQEKHRVKIESLLSHADRYAAECHRDVEIASSLGFKGQIMPVMPNAGGFSETELSRQLTDATERKKIMVKGYQGWVGRAHIAIESLEMISSKLEDFEIIFFSCNRSTKRLAAKLAKRSNLNVTAFGKGALSHEAMLDNFAQSLIYVGLSLSDGISTSMLEAMAMGAVPVQTSTSCCDEWFTDTGIAIEKLGVEEVARGVLLAIEMARNTDAALKNLEKIKLEASRDKIVRQALEFYRV